MVFLSRSTKLTLFSQFHFPGANNLLHVGRALSCLARAVEMELDTHINTNVLNFNLQFCSASTARKVR